MAVDPLLSIPLLCLHRSCDNFAESPVSMVFVSARTLSLSRYLHVCLCVCVLVCVCVCGERTNVLQRLLASTPKSWLIAGSASLHVCVCVWLRAWPLA
jgi:hypothetical protein